MHLSTSTAASARREASLDLATAHQRICARLPLKISDITERNWQLPNSTLGQVRIQLVCSQRDKSSKVGTSPHSTQQTHRVHGGGRSFGGGDRHRGACIRALNSTHTHTHTHAFGMLYDTRLQARSGPPRTQEARGAGFARVISIMTEPKTYVRRLSSVPTIQTHIGNSIL